MGLIITKFVKDKIDNLILTLYQKEYFGSMETSESYCMKIYTAMLDIQSVKLKRKCKKKTNGEYFVRFEANKKTQYFLLFDKEEEDILVTDYTNNHEKGYSSILGVS